jgi:hypothetical protein
MLRSDSERIAEHLRDEQPLLDDLFGAGGYTIEAVNEHCCLLRSDQIEIVFAYDPRDRWVCADIKPLTLPMNLREQISSHMWPPFAGRPASMQSKGPLDAERVRAELRLIEEIIRAERAAPGTLRDWAFFTSGYNRCYTDRVSDDFRDRWRLRFLGRLFGPRHGADGS